MTIIKIIDIISILICIGGGIPLIIGFGLWRYDKTKEEELLGKRMFITGIVMMLSGFVGMMIINFFD